MNKKLICLTLSILMLLTCVLTGCSGNKDEEDESDNTVDNSAKTITMWLIQNPPALEDLPDKVKESIVPEQKKDEKTGAALFDSDGAPIMETYDEAVERVCMAELKKAQDAVQVEFAAMTKAKFKTNVILKFCTEEEYYEKLEESIEKTEAAIQLESDYAKALKTYRALQKKTEEGKNKDTKTLTIEFHALPENAIYKHLNPYDPANNIDLEDDDTPETDVYTENDDGVKEILYPDPKDNQVDIFYIGNITDASGKEISGYDKYMEYYDADWLSSLNEELSTSSKKLESYISTSLLKGVEIDAVKYAIPNNVAIGSYTYMFIDKELFSKYYHKIDSVNDVTDLGLFFSDIMYENTGKEATADDYIVPLAATFEDCIKMLAWYWDIDYADPTVYETYFDVDSGRNYVLKKEYKLGEDQSADEGESSSTTVQTSIIDIAVADALYKMDDEGHFLDAEGNILPYTYAIETEYQWVLDENGVPQERTPSDKNTARTLYLVDGDGNPVTPENDARVILTEDIETNLDEYGNVRPTYRYFINQDSDFSILGTLIQDPSLRNRGDINLAFTSLFTNSEYRDLYATLKEYEYKNYYGTPVGNQTAAVSFVKGDARILEDYNEIMAKVNAGDSAVGFVYDSEKYGTPENSYIRDGKEYYILVAEYPMASEDELYGNMFAVYANSSYLSRSMKVITYLNTNTEMRDLLQYGIEGYHYQRNEDEGTVTSLLYDDDYGIYPMELERTGNCFIATPDESLGADAWTYAKIQNNASLINPLLGFDFNTATADSDYNLDVELIDFIKRLNQEAQELIDACGNSKDALLVQMNDVDNGFVTIFSASGSKAKYNVDKMSKALNAVYDPSMPGGANSTQPPDTSGSSPYTVYYEWLVECDYLPAN